MPSDDQKFASFNLPDITKVDPTVLTKFSTTSLPKWRTVHKGLNLEGVCKKKKGNCQAYGKRVWVNLGFGIFSMSMEVCKAKCPMCQKPTKGDKKIGIYLCELTGRGMKVKKNNNAGDTDDEMPTVDSDREHTGQSSAQDDDEEVEEEFKKMVCDSKDGFLKMDGVNGPFVRWRYMTLEIKFLSKK